MTWKRICSTDEIAENALSLFDVDGISILIVNYSGGFKAIPPMCPHMEEPLQHSGLCDGKLLTCTKHLWQWDLNSGEPQAETEKTLLTYGLKVEGTEIHVLVEQELVYEFDENDENEDDDSFWED